MIIKVGGGLEPLGPIGVYAYDGRQSHGRYQQTIGPAVSMVRQCHVVRHYCRTDQPSPWHSPAASAVPSGRSDAPLQHAAPRLARLCLAVRSLSSCTHVQLIAAVSRSSIVLPVETIRIRRTDGAGRRTERLGDFDELGN